MKQIFIALSAITLLTAGCTKNDITDSLRKEGSLSFSLSMAGALNTRAAELTATELQGSDIDLWTYHNATQALYFKDRLTWQTDEWNTTDHIRFMPVGGILDFYAVYPSGAGTFANNSGVATLAYTIPASQVDLVAATVLGSSTAAVTLKAHHLLSQVNFAVSGGSGKEIGITSIVMNGVNSAATFTFNPTATSAGAWGAPATPVNYTYLISGNAAGGNTIPIDAAEGTYYVLGDGGKWAAGTSARYWNSGKAGGAGWDVPANITPANNPKNSLMLLPQSFAANLAAEVVIDYTIDGVAADIPYTIPLNSLVDWQAGKRYVYLLVADADNDITVDVMVQEWDNESLDVTIEGDPFLDVSNVAVDVYDAAATRIYFYSNMPEVILDDLLLNGTQTLPVNDYYEGLTGLLPKNFTYIYDTATQTGEGYFDLINIHTDNTVTAQRKLFLKAGKLVREITATTRVSSEAAKMNTQPFIGTFHRYSERGERIISWHLPTTTIWKVEIVTNSTIDEVTANGQVYADAAHLRIDHLASPNHSKLYTLEPPSAEGAFVMEEIVGDMPVPIVKIEGRGRVYFRVGWDSKIGVAEHRFAKIKVTTTTDGGATTVSYLYCRQGEESIEIVSTSTIFAVYNISTPETFVNFPTKTGYLYQWNRTVPWAVTGAVNGYPVGVAVTVPSIPVVGEYEYKIYDEQSYICPAKYAYPDKQALDVMHNALNNTMYQWGYLADGFFDRRAVSGNIARNALGEIASAGGLFYSQSTARAIFLPTTSWRNYLGNINSLPASHSLLGEIGHYWSMAQEGEWTAAGGGSPVVTPVLNAVALHLTRAPSPTSFLETTFNKASAANVRCMRLVGKTVYFDSNGGQTTPRTVTQESGDISFPSGPQHTDPALEFVNWASTRGGGAPTYNAGATVGIAAVGDKTFYAQYVRVGYNVNGVILALSPLSGNVNYANAFSYCSGTLNGVTGWRLPTYDEAVGLFLQIPDLHFSQYSELWTSSQNGAQYYTLYKNTTTTYTQQSRAINTTSGMYARCVRQLN